MGQLFDTLDDDLRAWIPRQALFFVGTAPLAADGHVNLSPKGPIGSLQLVDDRTVAYLDSVGSGAETIAHLRENGRIVIMLCAFAGPPRIVRLHGRGEILLPSSPAYADLLARLPFADAGTPDTRRSVILVHLTRISDSCGYGVPRMNVVGPRPQMATWAARKLAASPTAIADYQRKKNATSIDGLPALDPDEP